MDFNEWFTIGCVALILVHAGIMEAWHRWHRDLITEVVSR